MKPEDNLWLPYLDSCRQRVSEGNYTQVCGRVTRVAGLVMEVAGLKLAIGSPCYIPLGNNFKLDVEVVGFGNERLFLMPLGDVEGVKPGALVFPNFPRPALPKLFPSPSNETNNHFHDRRLPVGHVLLGRVLDATGKPLDGKGPIESHETTGRQLILRWMLAFARLTVF